MSERPDTTTDLQWGRINAKHGGELESRMRTLVQVCPSITIREAKIGVLRELGYTVEEIAGELSVSPNTVRNQCNSLRKKLGAGPDESLRLALARHAPHKKSGGGGG